MISLPLPWKRRKRSVDYSIVEPGKAATNNAHAPREPLITKNSTDGVSRALRLEVEHWLDWQSRMISGVLHGAVFLHNSDNKNFTLTAIGWPNSDADDDTVASAGKAQLQKIAQQVIDSRSSVIQVAEPYESEEIDYIGCTLGSGALMTGAVVFALSPRTESQRATVLQLVQWCVVWLESQLNASVSTHKDTHELTHTAISILSDDGPIPVVGNAFCNLLADHFGCSLVSLGLKNGLQVHMAAVSHRVIFDRRSNSMNMLELSMEECIDQGERLMVPGYLDTKESVVHAHLQALKKTEYAQLVSFPITHNGESIGVLTLGRQDDDEAFDQVRLGQIDTLVERIAPIILLKRLAATTVAKRLTQKFHSHVLRLTGPSNYKLKAITGLSLCILVLLTAFDTNRIVPAAAIIEGETQQAIVVQANSYVQSVGARAGDRVSKGQVLATLNSNELVLEREKWQSELVKRKGEQQQAWAVKDPAQVTIATSRIDQSKAQLAQIETRIRQSRMEAPFDGYLISGDLSQSIGAPVTRGQMIFEIIPNANYKLVLDVEEHQISQVKVGQRGTLRLTGVPGERIELSVSEILPVAATKNGKSVFRVEADVIDAPADFRPGLRGVAKLVVGRASYLSAWTEQTRRKLRLLLWYYGF